jgi:stress response protein YsnF
VDAEGLAPMAQSGIAGSGSRNDMQDAGSENEQVIPVANEELEVGKRETERRYCIRTYVVERPVEEQVHLRDERVVVERRPILGERATGGEEFGEREFEVTERHEEPVVAKKARAVEEVVVHKEAKDRVETVRDRVRETKVDVDNGTGRTGQRNADVDRAAAGNKPAAAPAESMATESGQRIDQPRSDKAADIEEGGEDTIAPDRKI